MAKHRETPAHEGIFWGRGVWGPTQFCAAPEQEEQESFVLNHGVRARTLQKWFIFLALRALELCVVSSQGFAIPRGFPGSNAPVSFVNKIF